jgi:hypothetical protein
MCLLFSLLSKRTQTNRETGGPSRNYTGRSIGVNDCLWMEPIRDLRHAGMEQFTDS